MTIVLRLLGVLARTGHAPSSQEPNGSRLPTAAIHYWTAVPIDSADCGVTWQESNGQSRAVGHA